MSYFLDLAIQALNQLDNNIGTLENIYEKASEISGDENDDSFKRNIRVNIYKHSSDSEVFRGKDIFYSVGFKRSGIWGLRK